MSLTRYEIVTIKLPGGDSMTRMEMDSSGEWMKAEDVRAVLEPFLHRIVISERTPQELKDWAYRLLQELVP